MKKSDLKATHCILVCMGDKCKKKGKKLKQKVEDGLAKADLDECVTVHQTGCMHRCSDGPNVSVYPSGVAYTKAGKKSTDKIVDDVAKAVGKS